MDKPHVRVFPNMLNGKRLGDYYVYRRARSSDGVLCVVAAFTAESLLPKIKDFDRCCMEMEDMPTLAIRYLAGDCQTLGRTIQVMLEHRVNELTRIIERQLAAMKKG